MTRDIAKILSAMRADCIPAANSGRWTVEKQTITPSRANMMHVLGEQGKNCRWEPSGPYTFLWCQTLETMMSHPIGECVMNDFPSELRKHLQFIMVARGRVLVTGLGLGCVVRGLLAHGRCDSIEVVERSQDVLKLCAASVQDERVSIRVADATHYVKGVEAQDGGICWDYAWHDLWSDPERNEPHLQLTHYDMMRALMDKVRFQGAWALPRKFTQRIPQFVLNT